jgi:hypothetical protein
VKGDDGDGFLGSRASSSSERITSGGARGRSFLAVAVVVAAVLAAGSVLTPNGGDSDDGDEPTGAEMAVTDATDVSAAYAEAALGLRRARTFAFRGTVRSEESSLIRPGPRAADEVTVEGAVHLPLSITTELALAPDGEAVETVTSGPAAWARRAADEAGLTEAPWTVVREDVVRVMRPGPREPAPSRLGLALVVDAVTAAGDSREVPEDEEGRRVFRATVPLDRTPQGADPTTSPLWLPAPNWWSRSTPPATSPASS